MTTVPHQPIPRPAHVDRAKADAHKAVIFARNPEARALYDMLHREGPRAALAKAHT